MRHARFWGQCSSIAVSWIVNRDAGHGQIFPSASTIKNQSKSCKNKYVGRRRTVERGKAVPMVDGPINCEKTTLNSRSFSSFIPSNPKANQAVVGKIDWWYSWVLRIMQISPLNPQKAPSKFTVRIVMTSKPPSDEKPSASRKCMKWGRHLLTSLTAFSTSFLYYSYVVPSERFCESSHARQSSATMSQKTVCECQINLWGAREPRKSLIQINFFNETHRSLSNWMRRRRTTFDTRRKLQEEQRKEEGRSSGDRFEEKDR